MMLLSFCAFAACSDSSEDDENTTDSKTDTQTFANADFEYFDDSDGSYLIGGADSWTNSTDSNNSGTSASSSSAKSGIVDTSLDWGDDTNGFYQAYADYLYYDQLEEDDPDSPELEDPEYYTDIDNYYDIPGWDVLKTELEKTDDSIDLTDAETIKAQAAEIAKRAKALNPGTHWADEDNADELDEENGTHVLMLHNYRSDGRGTAQKYTSSSITLSAGTEAMFSVWVNTRELTYNDGKEVNGNRGAYIAVTNTVGGNTQDPLVVRNIDTKGEWQQFTFYIQASDYAATTFAVELGLGNQDNGTSTNKTSYVQGYAFFDDLHYEVKTAGSFQSEIDAADADGRKATLDLTYGTSYTTFDATEYTESERSFALNLKDVEPDPLSLTLKTDNEDGVKPGDYASTINGVRPTTDDRGNTILNSAPLLESDLSRLTDIPTTKTTDTGNSGWKSADALKASDVAALREAFANYDKLPFMDSDTAAKNIFLLYSSQGAPYTASASSDLFKLAKDEYMLLSFWVKTSDLQGGTGATVSVVEDGNKTKTSISAVDTTTIEATDLTDDFNGKKGTYEDAASAAEVREDIYDGWQQCFFFVANTTDETITFTLEFNYGVTSDFGSTTAASFVPGFAAFAGFSAEKLTEAQYNNKTTGTYAVDVALAGNSAPADSSFDDVADVDSEKIKDGFGTPANYEGTYGGSHRVGGDTINTDTLDTAGLLSKDYADNYVSEYFEQDGSTITGVPDAKNKTWLDVLSKASWITGSFDQTNWWTTVFGSDSTQPLLIVNTVEQAYGFFAREDTSVSTSSYAMVTVRVKLSPGATANIYLIDTEADETTDADLDTDGYVPHSYKSALEYGVGISYRYDNEGNVVNLDPEDQNFSTRSNTLFYMQDNGLWLPKGVSDTSVYYANLANYETDDEGNRVDSDGNIVYYATDTDGEYYRYYDQTNDEYSVLVRDFKDAGFTDEELSGAILQDLSGYSKALQQTVEWPATKENVSDWIYARFFLSTGDEAKSYRLEVWSGDRTGATKNPEDSFVMFEMVNYGTLDESTFTDNVSDMVDRLIDAYNADPNLSDADKLRDENDLIEAYRENPADFVDGKYGDTELIYFLYSLYDDNDYASYDPDYSDSANSPYDLTTQYSDTVSFLRTHYTDETLGRTYYDTYVNYSASEKTVSSSSDSDDSTTDDTTDNTPGYNVWLLVVSIVLAAVLIFTLIVLLIRKLLANMKKKPSKATQAYDNKRKRYIRKLKLEEAEKDDSAEDVLPEDDEITEEDIYKVETDEEKAEEPAESAEESDEAQSESPAEDKKDE